MSAYRLDFRALMAQYEENYRRLMVVLPVIASHDTMELRLPLPAGGSRVLRIRVIERCRYTTELTIQQSSPAPAIAPLVMTVRLYHDAHIAEVTGTRPHRQIPVRHRYPNSDMLQPDEKHQWNRFLGECLGFLDSHDWLSWRESTNQA